jgi:hypothetical protein
MSESDDRPRLDRWTEQIDMVCDYEDDLTAPEMCLILWGKIEELQAEHSEQFCEVSQ